MATHWRQREQHPSVRRIITTITDYAASINMSDKEICRRAKLDDEHWRRISRVGTYNVSTPVLFRLLDAVGLRMHLMPTDNADFEVWTACDGHSDHMTQAAAVLGATLREHAPTHNRLCLVAPDMPEAHAMMLEDAGWTLRTMHANTHQAAINHARGTVPQPGAWYRYSVTRFAGTPYALYLDADTMVVAALDSLRYEIARMASPITYTAMAPESSNPEYYNSGVMLFDVRRWEEYDLRDVIQASTRSIANQITPGTPYDQLVANRYLPSWGIVSLPQTWNYTPGGAHLKREIAPRIVHFRGPKPWQAPDQLRRKLRRMCNAEWEHWSNHWQKIARRFPLKALRPSPAPAPASTRDGREAPDTTSGH